MSYTNGLDKPDLYFNTVLYTGDSATSTAGTLARTISGVGFQPDFVWVKGRTTGGYDSHGLHDVVRTAPKWLSSDGTSAEADVTTGFNSGGIGSFTSDGFGIYSGIAGTTTNYNTSSTNYASWNWKANGTGVSNTSGSITSTVSANTTSGFSIVSYTGNGSSGATIGHGLGVAPKMIITKQRNSAGNWFVYHNKLPVTEYLILNSTVAGQTDNEIIYNDTIPSSTTFTVGNYSQINGSSNTFVSYCFAEKKGFSKFGSYTGNGSTDGTFVYTGFKPAFVMFKRTDTTSDWNIYDTARAPNNVNNKVLQSNLSNAESTPSETVFDYLSNGFKPRGSPASINASGGTYIYMAFAENPFVTSTGIPTTAR